MALSPENGTDHSVKTDTQASSTETKADLNQMFVLIEGILPFEACLYYQVLPLFIEGSRLHLGMVNPKDQAAADYVRRLVSYINCSISPQPIASDWHREILSKFLSHAAKNRRQTTEPETTQTSSPSTQNSSSAPPPKVTSPQEEIAPTPSQPTIQPTAYPSVEQTSSKRDSQTSPPDNFQEHPTLVVNFPDDLDLQDTPPSSPPTAPEHTSSKPPQPAPNSPRLKTKAPQPLYINPFDIKPEIATPKVTPQTSAPASETLSPLQIALPKEKPDTQPDHQKSLKHLENLPPKALTQQLLTQVINEGIGRIYLERQINFGRILWSKDGVLQSVLNEVDPQAFQGVINEMKLMMSLSLIPVRKSKQVEIERDYNNQRILLRFRVMPGNHGEEATLQILRGAALKFYQQQQIEKLSRDALGMAHTLQQRLNEIREQARQNLDIEASQSETFPAIASLLQQMENQIKDMMP